MNDPHSALDPLAALAGEFAERYRHGERPSLAEYTARHPELAEQIRELFPTLMVMEELGSVEGPSAGSPANAHERQLPELLGDYRIVSEIGRGGMGIVYEAVQESLGRHVALKVLRTHRLLPSSHLERFRREAWAAARLHHTNIVPVHGIGEHEGVHYYAMQFIRGQGLDEVLKAVKQLRSGKGPPATEGADPGADRSQVLAEGLLSGHFAAAAVSSAPLTQSASAGSASGMEWTAQPGAPYFRGVARIGAQVAAGLDYAHQQGILHRDIKPSNLLLDTSGTVWITDFGLARAEGADELTQTGDIVGTLRYMAPERFHGRSDPRSDVYGLGITLYELLTLRPAFENPHRPRLIEQVTQDEPARPRKVDRSIPRDLETIVLKAIHKEPGRRYQTAAELGEDLTRFLAGEAIRARRTGAWERAVKWVKRRPTAGALVAVSVVAALLLIGGVLIHNVRLGAALQDAQDNLGKARLAEEQARLAEQEKTQQLALAQVSEARARRNSGLVGRRFDSLEALKKAAEHFRALGQLDEARTLELRNEAIACLALVDMKPGKKWAPEPGWSRPHGFDSTLQYYAVRSTADDRPEKHDVYWGQLSIRRVADDQEVARLPGFGVRVVKTQFSADSRYLAAHYDWVQRYNYVWDLSRREAVLKVSQGTYNSFPAFSPDCRLVAFARPDNSIRIHELPSGGTWKELPPGLPVDSVHFHPDGRRLAVVSGKLVQLHDLNSGERGATFKHPNAVASLAWRGEGKVFATGCYGRDIYLWDTASPAQPLRILKGHFGPVVHLAFSHGGDLLFSNSWDSTDRLWDPMTGQQLVSRPGGVYREHRFGPDDLGLDDGWQVATGRECRTFHGPRNAPSGVAISPRGRLMASVNDAGVLLWDLAAAREDGKHLATLPVGASMAVQFDPKGESLITDSKIVGLQRWPIVRDSQTDGLRIGPPQSLGLSAQAPLIWPGYDPDFALSADGRTVAHSPGRGHVLLFDWESPRRKLLIESPSLRHAAFSPDGRWLATGSWQGQGARIWDARTGRLAHLLDLGESEDKAAWPAFSPDGQWLVVGSFTEYRFWETGSWQPKHRLPRENAGESRGASVFSPDGKILAVLHGMTEVRLVAPATGREYARLPAAGGPYCFSPDGSQLVTYAGRDGVMQVWDLRLIRRQLKEMDLDWDLPPYPPPSEDAKPLRVQVLAGERPLDSNELRAAAYLERGILYLQSGKYGSAAVDFERASRLDLRKPPWEAVVRAYSQVLERDPKNTDLYHMRAHAHERLGQWDQSISDHGQVIQRAGPRPELLICRGRAYLRAGQKEKAAEDFLKAGEQSPDQANHLAWELATSPDPGNREPRLAVALARQATGQAPGVAVYWTTLGVAHYRLGEWDAAVKALEEAEKRAPGQHFGCNAFFLAMCHQQLGDTAKAREHYDRAAAWSQANEGKLSHPRQKELRAFRAEAEALLGTLPPKP